MSVIKRNPTYGMCFIFSFLQIAQILFYKQTVYKQPMSNC